MTTPLASLVSHLNSQFPERRQAITGLVTAVVAREHAVMYGPPGTGKSLLTRTLSASLNRSYFEYLMTRFTEPSEVMGAVDVAAFRDGHYIRNTSGKMPQAEVVFLDEIFKANSAILNSLLTILNERTYDAGQGPKSVPLMSCIGASNELPEGPELEALYDRLLVRLDVGYISDDDAFRNMLTAPSVKSFEGSIDIEAEQAAARAVQVTPETIDALIKLRTECKKNGTAVSDRRWRQCLNLVKAAAHVDARLSTSPEDLEILESVLWHKPSERMHVSKMVQTVIAPDAGRAVEYLDAASAVVAKLTPSADLQAISVAVKDLKEIHKSLSAMAASKRRDAAMIQVASMQKDVAKRAMKAAGIGG